MNRSDYAAEGERLSSLLDKGVETLREQVRKQAEAEREYRKAKSQAWVRSRVEVSGPVAEKQAWVDAETADLRFERDLAEGMKRAAIEALRSRQEQIGLLRTFIASDRSEMELAR